MSHFGPQFDCHPLLGGDSISRLSNLIELDETDDGAKRFGKRSCGAEGKRPVIVMVETWKMGAGFQSMQAMDNMCKDTVGSFLTRPLRTGQTVKTDALCPH